MNKGDAGTATTWSARSVRPAVAFYVLGVFCGFIALAQFGFHSPEAVKALFMAGVASMASLIPMILRRVEYRATEAGVARRARTGKEPRDFEDLFLWDELSHVVPTRSGFKYYKRLIAPNRLARLLRLHFSGKYSGQLHAEPDDVDRIRAVIRQRGIRIPGSRDPLKSNTLPETDR